MNRIFPFILILTGMLSLWPAMGFSSDMTMGPLDADAAGQWSSMRPDGHTPGGVMGGDLHHAGKWMLSYRLGFMNMKGNRDGTDGLSVNEVFAGGYGVSPLKMTMQMHMFGAMYSPSDKITLMAAIPYVLKSMDHRTSPGFVPAPDTTFTTESKGLADIKLTGLIPLVKAGQHRLHLNAGLSFPTGSIDEKDDLPPLDGSKAQLPYPMQLGSGTYDLLMGLTYTGQTPDWSWGGQAAGIYRAGENDNDYTSGDMFSVTSWIARRWSSLASTSLRINGQLWGNIEGADSSLTVPPGVNPTADPALRGGRRLDLLFGTNIYIPGSRMRGHRFSLEGGLPVYQSLDGPQLETDWMLTLGYRYAL